MKALRWLLAVSCAWLAAQTCGAAVRERVKVEVAILDEQGKPIPHVTVWGSLVPRKNPLAIDADDLWRITQRYQDSCELALPYALARPVAYLRVHRMGDAAGHFRTTIDYRDEEGSGARLPEQMSVAFTFMKRGYEPGRVGFSIRRERSISGRVILKRAAGAAAGIPPYREEFDRLRYELSDPERNAEMSLQNHHRLQQLQVAFEAAAQQAIAAGDKRTAGLIYARMQHFPRVIFSGGKPSGYSQGEPESAEALACLEKAYMLAPDHPHIAAMRIFRKGADRFGKKRYSRHTESDAERREFAEYLKRLQDFTAAQGNKVWPAYHQLYALWHGQSDIAEERARVRPLVEALYRFEPKFKTHEDLVKSAADSDAFNQQQRR